MVLLKENIKKEIIEENSHNHYEMCDDEEIPQITPMDNPEEFLKNNGAIPLNEFIARVSKF